MSFKISNLCRNSSLIILCFFQAQSVLADEVGQGDLKSCVSNVNALREYVGKSYGTPTPIATARNRPGCLGGLTGVHEDVFFENGKCVGRGKNRNHINLNTTRLYFTWQPDQFADTVECSSEPLIDRQRFSCQFGIDQMRNDTQYSRNGNFGRDIPNSGCPFLGLRNVFNEYELSEGTCYATAFYGRAIKTGISWDVNKHYRETLRCYDQDSKSPFNQ